MNIYQTLNVALEQYGFPRLKRTDAYRQIGAGAWHEAYRVHPPDGDRKIGKD